MKHIRATGRVDDGESWSAATIARSSTLGGEPGPMEEHSILRETIASVRRRILPLVVWVLICFSAALAYVLLVPPKFLGVTQVVLEPRQPVAPLDPAAASTAPALDSAQADSQVQVIQSERNLRYVFDTLDLADDPDFAAQGFDLVGWIQSHVPFFHEVDSLSPEEKARRARELAYGKFADSVTVKRLAQSYAFEISFLAPSAKKAASLANSVTAAYIRDQVIYNIAATAAQRGDDFLQNRISGSKTEQDVATEAVKTGVIPDYTFGHADARIVSAAIEPINKSYPMTTLVLALSIVFAGLTGVGAIIAHSGLDRTIRSREQLRRLTGISAIGVLSRLPRRRPREKTSTLRETIDFPGSDFARTILKLRAFVLIGAMSPRHACVGILSCGSGEGRSTVAANLAHAIAASGRPVTLIDADLQNPALTKTLSPTAVSGLSELVEARAADATGLQLAMSPGLSFIPAIGVAGVHDPRLFIGSRETLEAISALTAEREVVLDLPPVSKSDDAIALCRCFSGVIVVAGINKTSVDDLTELLKTLHGHDVSVIGVLLNETGSR